jgi:ankyrin repeat protein
MRRTHFLFILTFAVFSCAFNKVTAMEISSEDKTALIALIAKDNSVEVQQFVGAKRALLSVAFDENGRTALHLSADHNAIGSARVLLSEGADFYARDSNGQLALDFPPGQELNETRKLLREINRKRNEFLSAVHDQKPDQIKKLLAEDSSLRFARDIGDGWSAVMTACHFGNVELLKLLIDAGADLNATDFNSGQSAIYMCAEKGYVECLRLLTKAGVNPNQTWRVNYGHLPMEMNALHVASWKGHNDVVDLLLNLKVDPNIRAKSYAMFSALHFAASDGHAEVVNQLLAAGADTLARDGRRGITALQMAQAGKHGAAAALLRAR